MREQELMSPCETNIGKLAARMGTPLAEASAREARLASELTVAPEQTHIGADFHLQKARAAIAASLRQQAEVGAETLRAQKRASDEALATLKPDMESILAESQHAPAVLLKSLQVQCEDGGRRAAAQEAMPRQLHDPMATMMHHKVTSGTRELGEPPLLDLVATQPAQVVRCLCPITPGPHRCLPYRADSLLRLPRRRILPTMMMAPKMVVTTMWNTLR